MRCVPTVEISNVVKSYKAGAPVLDDISLSFERSEFATIYGKSGSGKTTLLNLMGGLDRPTSGHIKVDGVDITNLPEDRLAGLRLEKIGFVFQDSNLLSDLTVRDNVAIPLRFSKRKVQGRADELLERFGLQSIADERANRISGGEAQRTAIARAMINEPRIILADEPTGSLDSDNTDTVLKAFELLTKDFETTIILATHDKEIAAYASSTIRLEDGKAFVEASNGIRSLRPNGPSAHS